MENQRNRKIISRNKCGPDERYEKFRKKVRYGPVFICTCCHQRLFENQVEMYTEDLKENIDRAYPNLREELIPQELITNVERVEDKDSEPSTTAIG